jgi:hypothetical protein
MLEALVVLIGLQPAMAHRGGQALGDGVPISVGRV